MKHNKTYSMTDKSLHQLRRLCDSLSRQWKKEASASEAVRYAIDVALSRSGPDEAMTLIRLCDMLQKELPEFTVHIDTKGDILTGRNIAVIHLLAENGVHLRYGLLVKDHSGNWPKLNIIEIAWAAHKKMESLQESGMPDPSKIYDLGEDLEEDFRRDL
jgi:hypothetical protein